MLLFNSWTWCSFSCRCRSWSWTWSRHCCLSTHRLSQPGVKSDYLQDFMDETGLDEATVRTLARQALSELLFDYSNFNVSTIDSFFQSILRNFARELDRDFNYDIQLDEKYAVRAATHSFLLTLGLSSTGAAVHLCPQIISSPPITKN